MKMKISKYWQASLLTLFVFMEALLRFRGNSLSFYSDLNIGALFNENYVTDIYVDSGILNTLPILYITNFVTFENDLAVFILLYCLSFNVFLLYKILKAVTYNTTLTFSTITILIFIDISPIEMSDVLLHFH